MPLGMKVGLVCVFSAPPVVGLHRSRGAVLGAGQKKIVLKAVGKGGHSEMTSFCREDEVLFLFLRLMDGDKESKRVKFVFITFVGEHVGGMPRGRVGSHMSNIKPLFGVGTASLELPTDPKAYLALPFLLRPWRTAIQC